MSKIDDQIKELEKRKTKIGIYSKVLKNLEDNTKVDQKIKQEVFKELSEFVDAQVEAIESGQASTGLAKSAVFSDEEVKILKALATRAQQAKSTPKQNKPTAKPQPKPAPINNNQDKLSFALSNQHLANQQVQVISENGNISGVVQGLDAPFVVVKTKTGHTINVPLEKIIV